MSGMLGRDEPLYYGKPGVPDQSNFAIAPFEFANVFDRIMPIATLRRSEPPNYVLSEGNAVSERAPIYRMSPVEAKAPRELILTTAYPRAVHSAGSGASKLSYPEVLLLGTPTRA